MFLYNTVKFLANIFFRLIYRIDINGKENIPKDGKLVLCSNHINNMDPLFLSMVFPRQIHWMAKKQLFKNKVLAYFLYQLGAFPVDREESDISAIKNSFKVLKKEGVLGIFPEGTRVKKFNIENVKPGVALISIKSQAPVLPVYIEGSFRPFSKVKISFGEIIYFPKDYDKKLSTEDYHMYSKEILKSIYSVNQKGGI